MAVNLELKFAEGRLYAEGRLSEYMKLATGGTMSIATKAIAETAAQLMYGAKPTSRTLTGGSGKAVTGTLYTDADIAKYVGVSFYAPDLINGATKYTCVFVRKALFGPPAMAYKTKGQNIEFGTPTTTGEFLGDDSADGAFFETAICDTIEDAKAWCDQVFTPAKGG